MILNNLKGVESMRYRVTLRDNAGNVTYKNLLEYEIDSYKSMGYKIIEKYQL